MSKPRFNIILEIDTLAHANTIKNNIQSELAGKDLFEQRFFSISTDTISNKIILFADWRFNSAIDRDALKDWARDQIENHPNVKNWVQKAKLSWHRCTHDESLIENCEITNYFEWNK